MSRCGVLFDLLTDAAAHAPDTPAVITPAETVTFAQLVTVWRPAPAQLAGVTEPGDRVAVLAENCVGYVELYYAAPAGRVLVPQSPATPLGVAAHARPHRRARCSTSRRRSAARVEPDPGVTRLDLSLPAPVTSLTAPGRTDTDVAWLIGTSGTTGDPKLAMLTDASLVAAVDATLGARPVGPDDVLLTPFPLCHVAGYNVLVLHRRGPPDRPPTDVRHAGARRLVRDHTVTMLSLAPTMIAMLLDHPDVDDADLAHRPRARIRRVTDPGAGPAARRRAVGLGLLPGLRHDRAVRQRHLPRPGRAPCRGAEVTTACSWPAGAPRPAWRSGSAPRDELLIRALQVMHGYWEDATRPPPRSTATVGCTPATSARLDPDGIVTDRRPHEGHHRERWRERRVA